ncbi:MAG: serine/threonine-protein kinase [Candidatus Margulisiibacteriota bacterium]|jgi:serine/threonine-protein kinase
MSTIRKIPSFSDLKPSRKISRPAPSRLKQPADNNPGRLSLPKVDFTHTVDQDHIANLMSATHNCLMNTTGPIEFGPFLLRSRLGAGGYGVTFKAIDMRDGKESVVKVPLRFEEDNFRALIEEGQKALVSGSLDGQVVTVKGIGDVNGVPYIAMEYIDGFDLSALLELNGDFLPLKRSLEIVIGLCDAVEHCHSLGVFHRDIKPSNIMIGNDGRVVLIDPGLSAVGNDATGFAGTPLYFSPEQSRGEQLTPRSEIFTVGVILFEILTGEHPFGAYTHSALMQNIQSNEPDFSLLPQKTREQKQLFYVIRRALAKDPKRRPASAAELRSQLAIILAKLP